MRRNRLGQYQGATADQLRALVGIANQQGLYDAADVVIKLLKEPTGAVAGRPSVSRDEAEEQRVTVLNRDGWRCRNQMCRSTRHLTVDHIRKRSDGGPDDLANQWTLCTMCHDLKEAGVLVPVQDQKTGEWLLIDTRRAVRCSACHRALLVGETAVVPTNGAVPRETVIGDRA